MPVPAVWANALEMALTIVTVAEPIPRPALVVPLTDWFGVEG